MFLQPVTNHEVISVIVNLTNSCCCDIDGIQVRPVKFVAEIIAPVLTNIFNLCLTTGTFPQKKQTAKVTVLYKKGDRSDLGNYRPVSIIPILSKVCENILYIRLSNFVNKQPYFAESVWFCKNKSTELALLEQKGYILTQFENKAFVIGVFVDFRRL